MSRLLAFFRTLETRAFATVALAGLVASGASAQPNTRPPAAFVPASTLVPKCRLAVRFNEDESSVQESDFVDASYCLGLIRGVLGTNEHLSPMVPLFCLPPSGLKTWQAAKHVLAIAQGRPEMLKLSETEFVVRALKLAFPCSEGVPDSRG